MSIEELKPCPMCGGAAHLTKGYATENVWAHGEFHRVFCGACQIRQLFYRTAKEAISAWNRRAFPAAWDQSGTKTPETRMDAAFEGGPNFAQSGADNSNSPEFDGIRSAAPAAGTEKDAERLDFMITEECQIERMDRIGATPLYRLRWPWLEEQQAEWSASGREAIDTATAAKGALCGS